MKEEGQFVNMREKMVTYSCILTNSSTSLDRDSHTYKSCLKIHGVVAVHHCYAEGGSNCYAKL